MEIKMLKRTYPVLLGLVILLTACGPQGTPTMAPADVQNTAVAAAWTMVAATQQAIPTATPLPPTETPSLTPLPTFTPLALPTQAAFIPSPTTQAAAGDCLVPLNTGEAGPTTRMRLENDTGGPLNLSLNLWIKNAFGQCGALSYTLSKNETRIVNLPRGSWYAYAWITLKNGTSTTASCSFEIRVGSTDLGRLVIGQEACHAQDI
jgi:hypothetical protein